MLQKDRILRHETSNTITTCFTHAVFQWVFLPLFCNVVLLFLNFALFFRLFCAIILLFFILSLFFSTIILLFFNFSLSFDCRLPVPSPHHQTGVSCCLSGTACLATWWRRAPRASSARRAPATTGSRVRPAATTTTRGWGRRPSAGPAPGAATVTGTGRRERAGRASRATTASSRSTGRDRPGRRTSP